MLSSINIQILLTLVAFAMGFLIVFITIPPVIRVSKAKKLFDLLDERKVNKQAIPTIGGIAIFLGFAISTILVSGNNGFEGQQYLFVAIIIMMFTGLKDDLVSLSAKKKVFIEVIAAVILIVFGGFRITNLHGLFGIEEIGYVFSFSLSLVIILGIINSFNLIDGVDGLASGLAIIILFTLGTWFLLVGVFPLGILSFALLGSLAAFFRFNVFGRKNKIFMGDTGSLMVGIILSVLVIEFNESNIGMDWPFRFHAAPAVALGIFIVPVFDTLRVIAIRLWQKKSPFLPDNNHIHHRLLAICHSHLKVSCCIFIANVYFIALVFLMDFLNIDINVMMLFIILSGMALAVIPSFILRRKDMDETSAIGYFQPFQKKRKAKPHIEHFIN